MSYDVCDDYGVWVVVPKPLGRWVNQDDAQDECNKRNFDAGIAAEDGELKNEVSKEDESKFTTVHLVHPECTCSKMSKGGLDRKLNDLN